MKRIGPEDARLPKDDVVAQRWVFAELRVDDEPWGRRPSDRAAMLLPLDGSFSKVAELHHVIVKIERRGILLSGREQWFVRKQRFEKNETWWCKPLGRDELERATAEALQEQKEQVDAVAGAVDSPKHTTAQQLFIDKVTTAVGRSLAPAEEEYVVRTCDLGAPVAQVARHFRSQDATRRLLSHSSSSSDLASPPVEPPHGNEP